MIRFRTSEEQRGYDDRQAQVDDSLYYGGSHDYQSGWDERTAEERRDRIRREERQQQEAAEEAEQYRRHVERLREQEQQEQEANYEQDR